MVFVNFSDHRATLKNRIIYSECATLYKYVLIIIIIIIIIILLQQASQRMFILNYRVYSPYWTEYPICIWKTTAQQCKHNSIVPQLNMITYITFAIVSETKSMYRMSA